METKSDYEVRDMATHEQQLDAIDRNWSRVRADARNQHPTKIPDGVVAGHIAAMIPDGSADIDPTACRWAAIANIACDTVDERYPGRDYFGRLGLAVLVATELVMQAHGLYREQLHAVPALPEDLRSVLRTRAEAILNGLVS